MEIDLRQFKCTEVLVVNETEKTLYLLGKMEGQQGEAIAILTPKIYDPSILDFKNIHTKFINDIYSRYTADLTSSAQIQFIFPATEKHKQKYRAKQLTIHLQTGEEYAAKSQELLKKELAHIQWVNNIIEGKSEVERVLYKCQDFLIVPDFKFTELKEVKKMHLMVLFSHPQLHSLRNLKQQHLPILQNAREKVGKVLIDKFGIEYGNVRAYFHYPPTFYRLHIHIMHLGLQSLSCRVERCHDFNLVIQNIKIKGDYYQEATLNTFIEK